MNTRRSFFSSIISFFTGTTIVANKPAQEEPVVCYGKPYTIYSGDYFKENDPRLAVADVSRNYFDHRIKPADISVFCEKTQKFLSGFGGESIQHVNVPDGYYIYIDSNRERKIKTNQQLCLFFNIKTQSEVCTFSYKKHLEWLNAPFVPFFA